MKIVTKPVAFEDRVDKSRDIPGFSKWGHSSRTVGFIMFILGWFTIPVEVFLRRDFGQRWFTIINFYAGLFLLVICTVLQYLINVLWSGFKDILSKVASAINPLYSEPEPTLTERMMDKSMLFILMAYIVISCYHLFKIRWRNRTNTGLHSFDDGTSRLEGLAGYLMQLINTAAVPLMRLFTLLLPKKQRSSIQLPNLINDCSAFANTFVEPFILFVLAFFFQGITGLWLLISAIALAIHASWKESAKLNKILDFRDSMIEAQIMMNLKNTLEQDKAPSVFMQQAAVTFKENPQLAPQIAIQYPDLMSIIEEMNKDKSHLAN